MARVPISFYLNILAGIIVLFNHYVTSETGDVALNKVTGAAGRFYTLFRDSAYTFRHGCTSRLEMALCGSAVDNIFPRDAVVYLRAHYCYHTVQDSAGADGTSNDRKPHGGYGGSDFTFAHYQPPMRPLVLRTSAEDRRRSPNFSLGRSSQRQISQIVWDRSSEAMATIGTSLLRSCASWWWFRAPLKMTGFLLGISSALSVLGYLFGESVGVRYVSQVYMVVVADFLRCIEWEAQRQALDIGVLTMEQAHGFVTNTRKRAQKECRLLALLKVS